MTSSDNLQSFAAYEPWMFQSTPAYVDPWLTEAFTRDAEALTKAFQKTISNDTNNNTHNSDAFVTSSDAVSSFRQTPSASGVSGSDPEMAASRKRVAVTKKITKRKPRATKKCQTTFIMADPANFRQMVQQVTGVQFETIQHQQIQNQLIVKPEPKRLTGNGLPLPTLDTSSFFVEYGVYSQQQREGSVGVGNGQRQESLIGEDGVGQVAYGDSLISNGPGYGYESYQSFPTLESWKVLCD